MAELKLPPLPKPQAAQMCSQMRAMFAHAVGMHVDAVRGFPGTMPMTFSRRHASMIMSMDYVFLEKSDGVRYLLLILSSDVFLIDRRNAVFLVNPNPQIANPRSPAIPLGDSLLDGELCYNLKLKLHEYLVYDVVAIDGDPTVARRTYRERMLAADRALVAPRVLEPATAGLLRIRTKDTYEKSEIQLLFSRITKDPTCDEYIYENPLRVDGPLCNHNDGLILTPDGLPYPYKVCEALLKWKPPHLNSVDFVLQLERSERPQRDGAPDVKVKFKYQGDNGPVLMRQVYLPSAVRARFAADFNRYNFSVAEFSYDINAGEWRYIRQRDDKDKANYSSTVIDTLESIGENLRREDITKMLLMSQESRSLNVRRQRFESRSLAHRPHGIMDSGDEHTLIATPISTVQPPQLRILNSM